MSANRVPMISPEELAPSKAEGARRVRPTHVELRDFRAELERNVEGEVRFDAGSKVLFAVDASNYRQVPIGVVIPRSKEDVVQTAAACRKLGIPLLSRGGGTSLAGQC